MSKNNKGIIIGFRITPAEKKSLDAQCVAEGRTLSVIVHRRVFPPAAVKGKVRK